MYEITRSLHEQRRRHESRQCGATPHSMNTEATANPSIGLTQSSVLRSLFPATIFLGAFLLFLVEPIIAKMILPWFGGSAAVWATCLVFFQSALLLGYCYADLTGRYLSPKQQSLVHILFLVFSLFFFPLIPSQSWLPNAGGNPVWQILRLLAATIGLPFFILSATSPLTQVWFKRRNAQASPYHLFSLSNLASFLALLAYPFLLEPRLSTRAQSVLWSSLFAAFVLLCGSAAFISGQSSVVPRLSLSRTATTLLRKLHWLALSACGSMLLLTTTNHLTQNVTPVPLLWILPLAIYLLSFTLVFSRGHFYRRWLFIGLLLLFLGMMGYVLLNPEGVDGLQLSLPLFCIGLFVCCMFCHGELSLLKPQAESLTSFYLLVSLGGVLGTVFVALAAPILFHALYEFPLTLLLTALLALVTLWSEGWIWRAIWSSTSLVLLLVLVLCVRSLRENSVAMRRDFYGTLSVTEEKIRDKGPLRSLFHGTIRHGAQFARLPWRGMPTTYYGFNSGIGLALLHCCVGPRRVGIIGLGTGTLAAYGKLGDYFHFYDIDSDAIELANTYFTYLAESPATKEITLGDARLSLQSEPAQDFDVLAVDAFSGDAIPVHLLTQEAIQLYLRHLKPNGILAIHTSNSFLVLDGLVKSLADQIGYPSRKIENEDIDSLEVFASDWVLLSRNNGFMNSPLILRKQGKFASRRPLAPWTDDHNNLFEILKPLQLF